MCVQLILIALIKNCTNSTEKCHVFLMCSNCCYVTATHLFSPNGYHRSWLEVGEVKLRDVHVSRLSIFQEFWIRNLNVFSNFRLIICQSINKVQILWECFRSCKSWISKSALNRRNTEFYLKLSSGDQLIIANRKE